MKRLFVRTPALGLLLALWLAGCALTPPYQREQATQWPQQPSRWQARSPHQGQVSDLRAWWAQWQDPALSQMIEAAQTESASLAQAAARITAARGQITGSLAAAQPSVDASAAATRQESASPNGVLLYNQVSLQFQTRWELDLFGRLAQQQAGAQAQWQARTLDWHEARVSLAAEVAQSYSQYRYCEQLQQLLTQERDSYRQSSLWAEQAHRAGLQAQADWARLEAAAQQAENQLLQQSAECERQVKGLVQLTGMSEPTLRTLLQTRAGLWPQPAHFAISSIPADILAQRPDVARAEREMAVAHAALGQAEAERYPQLSLNGSIGLLHLQGLGQSANAHPWSIGPSLSVPIFDAGLRRANVETARAQYEAAASSYRAQARQAVAEVEQALVWLDSLNVRQTAVQQTTAKTREVEQADAERQRLGWLSLAELELSRRQRLQAERTQLQWRDEQIRAWIALYRAVGGGWSQPAPDSSTLARKTS